jgi:hypothetical protein
MAPYVEHHSCDQVYTIFLLCRINVTIHRFNSFCFLRFKPHHTQGEMHVRCGRQENRYDLCEWKGPRVQSLEDITLEVITNDYYYCVIICVISV